MARIKAGGILFWGLMAVSCAQAPKVSLLYTDIPELAFYAEIYNSTQNNFRIIPEFHSRPQDLLTASPSPADLVVGHLKMPPRPKDQLSSLDFIFDRSGEPRKNFYEGILDMGQHQGVQVLLPLSFNLPLVIGLKSSFPEDWPSLLVDTENLIAYSATLNRPQKTPPVMGYSLRWSPNQTESRLFASGWKPLPTEDGTLALPEQNPETFLASLLALRDLNGGNFEDRFTSKYLPGQGLKLLSDKRVVFYPSTILDHLSLPPGQLDSLDFRFPLEKSKVWATYDPVMMAFPRQAQRQEASEDFAAWLIKKDTQIMLLEKTADIQLKTFGYAGGLSSLFEVNETQISQPFPRRSEIAFPPALPQEWSEFTREVLHPWINRKLAEPQTESLSQAYASWKAQKNVDTKEKPL